MSLFYNYNKKLYKMSMIFIYFEKNIGQLFKVFNIINITINILDILFNMLYNSFRIINKEC